ncbi:MAG: alpha-amylase family protein, partial [Planctomycetota bacterium]
MLLLLAPIWFRGQASAASSGSHSRTWQWLQTARVFLIDAYYPPMAPDLEFDAEALAETMARMHVNTVRMATMGKYATIQNVRFARHPHQGDRDLLAETIAACKPRGIKVVPYISTGHKLAWSMVTEDYPEYAQRTRPGGGPQRSHMFVGEDHGTICWNTPYRQAFMDLVEHVVRDYDVAGVYFDTWRPHYFWPGMRVCYCDGCRKGFQEATGQTLPWRENSKDYTPKELSLIDKYHQWCADVLAEILHEVRRLVKSHKDIPLIYNINNPQKITAEDPRVIAAMDAFLYERGRTLLERAEGVSLARSMGMYVWPYVGTYGNWPRVIYDGCNYQQQIFTTAMFGGAAIMAQPYAYVEHAEYRRYVEYPFGVLSAHEQDTAGFENYPYVAVVYGYQDPPGFSRQTQWGRKVDTRSATLGAFAACLYGHVQVSSVHESILDEPERLARYKVLYLAGAVHLSKSRIENVKRFVREGGGLVTSFGASLYDA